MKKPSIRSKGTIIILDIKNTTAKQWSQYTERVEKELSDGNIFDSIMTLQNDCNKNHKNLDLNTNTNRFKLQKAWSQFEEILSKAAKATIKTKKVKGISKYNLPKRNCSKEISDLLSSLKLLHTLIKACTNTNWEKIKALKKNITSYNLNHPDTNLNDINLNFSQKDIPWNVWTGLIKSRYLILRDVCYKVKQ